jgi:hypothetical protein
LIRFSSSIKPHFLHVGGHDLLIPPVGLLQGWRLLPYTRVLDMAVG